MDSAPSPNVVQTQITGSDDEIDLRQVVAALGRQKILIACIACGSVLLSGWSAINRKPVWQGQFQIVLEQQNSGTSQRLAQIAAGNPLLTNLAGLPESYPTSSVPHIWIPILAASIL